MDWVNLLTEYLKKYFYNQEEEYYSCRNKWRFLIQKIGRNIFPDLDKTIFPIYDDILTKIKKDLEILENIEIKKFDLDYIEKLKLLFDKIKIITVFTARLRTAIIQRISSYSAIHQTFFPIPFSVEGILGDETTLTIADILAENYFNNLPFGVKNYYAWKNGHFIPVKWHFDRFITYESPDLHRLTFCTTHTSTILSRQSNFSSLIDHRILHILMGDQYRNSLIALSSLSHETSHCLDKLIDEAFYQKLKGVINNNKENEILKLVADRFNQFEIYIDFNFYYDQDLIQKLLEIQIKDCPHCSFVKFAHPTFREYERENISAILREILVDFLAYRIGGISFFNHLMDNFYSFFPYPFSDEKEVKNKATKEVTEITEKPPFFLLTFATRADNFIAYVNWRIKKFPDCKPDTDLIDSTRKKISLFKDLFYQRYPDCSDCPFNIKNAPFENFTRVAQKDSPEFKEEVDILDKLNFSEKNEFFSAVHCDNREEIFRQFKDGSILSELEIEPRHLFEVYYKLYSTEGYKLDWSFRTNFQISMMNCKERGE